MCLHSSSRYAKYSARPTKMTHLDAQAHFGPQPATRNYVVTYQPNCLHVVKVDRRTFAGPSGTSHCVLSQLYHNTAMLCGKLYELREGGFGFVLIALRRAIYRATFIKKKGRRTLESDKYTVIGHCGLRLLFENLPQAGRKCPLSTGDYVCSTHSLSHKLRRDRCCR